MTLWWEKLNCPLLCSISLVLNYKKCLKKTNRKKQYDELFHHKELWNSKIKFKSAKKRSKLGIFNALSKNWNHHHLYDRILNVLSIMCLAIREIRMPYTPFFYVKYLLSSNSFMLGIYYFSKKENIKIKNGAWHVPTCPQCVRCMSDTRT